MHERLFHGPNMDTLNNLAMITGLLACLQARWLPGDHLADPRSRRAVVKSAGPRRNRSGAAADRCGLWNERSRTAASRAEAESRLNRSGG
jgi:hypothetical protein